MRAVVPCIVVKERTNDLTAERGTSSLKVDMRMWRWLKTGEASATTSTRIRARRIGAVEVANEHVGGTHAPCVCDENLQTIGVHLRQP